MIYDCAIIGGGPAGLNAALILGRARRHTLLVDSNKPRNAVTRSSHGYLTRDGVSPSEFRQLAVKEISFYPSVRREESEIASITESSSGFRLETLGDKIFYPRKLILATGLKETLPRIEGLDDCYGISIFNCPYCDGWELRDKPLVLISESNQAYRLAMLLHNWSQNLIVCTNAKNSLSLEQQAKLKWKGIHVENQQVDALLSYRGQLEAVRFKDGSIIRRSGGFVIPNIYSSTMIGDYLGCERNENNGGFVTDELGRTNITGVYMAGDTATHVPSQLIIAAASGSRAAIGANEDLSVEAFSSTF